MTKEFFQQCTNCLSEKQFKALVNVVDFFYDKEEKDYNEKKAIYGDKKSYIRLWYICARP